MEGRRLGPTRAQVLELLQDAGTPMTVPELGERMGLHPNTARFHVEALEAAGLVERTYAERSGPGRPRAMFAAAPEAPSAARRSYRFLAEVLTSYFAEHVPETSARAEEAGEAWGRRLAVAQPDPVSADRAVEELVTRLDTIGFESHPSDAAGELRLDVHHCPFLEVADDHRDVVCAVHLGLMRGLLEEMDAPVSAESLSPLVEPSRCIAHLQVH